MKKFLKIIIINLIFFIVILGICEISIYKHQAKIFYDTHPKIFQINKYSYDIYYPDYMRDLKNYYNGQNNIFYGRKPDGLEYKNQTPITVFGCSFAFGQHMNFNQTFSYKLAHQLKKTVYNRAISGASFQQMYFQSIANEFYEDVPPSDTVIYIMIDDHYRRTMLDYFDILDLHVLLNFKIKNNKLVMNNYNNKLMNFIKSLYTTKYINHIVTNNYIKNPDNGEKIIDSAVLYFTETKKELEKRWNKKINFVVIFYENWDILYNDILRKKLEDNGFVVISTKELTNEDLNSEKYLFQDNYHPTEAAWNLLTPKIIEKAGLK